MRLDLERCAGGVDIRGILGVNKVDDVASANFEGNVGDRDRLLLNWDKFSDTEWAVEGIVVGVRDENSNGAWVAWSIVPHDSVGIALHPVNVHIRSTKVKPRYEEGSKDGKCKRHE